jgi:hypothetical protein
MGFARQGGVRATCLPEKEREGGVQYGNESEDSRADKRAGERGAYSAMARRVRRHATTT